MKLPITDPRVIRLGALQLAFDNAQARLITGQAFDLGDLLRLDAALQELRALCKPSLPSLELHIVDDTVKSCPFCHAHFNPRTGKAVEPEPLCGEVLPPIADKQRAAPAPKRKALPAPSVSGPQRLGSIHEQPGARMAVLDYSAIPSEWP